MYEVYQRLLDKKGVKNADVSRATGISNMTLSDWKRGKSVPKADKMQKIAEFLNVSVDYLMTGEEKEVPTFSTLNSFLYGNSKDIKLSTAVKLAKALNISIDELVGAETINEITKESMSICRNLPDNDLYLVRWFIRYLEKENSKIGQNKRFVSVMELDCSDGNLKITTSYKKVYIGNVNEIYLHKIFFGITMPCDNYMPHYSPYDILLIANDRNPTHTDNVLIRIGKYILIARIDFNNKVYSIRDNKYRCDMNEIDEVIGYICCVI